jgi:diadenosine tetraphosphatase ApaH/serine/threonine PP2A family protein phosphatase
VLAAAGEVDAVWHLGDIVGYGPEPDAVVARLREVGAVGVQGNHDAAAAEVLGIEWFNRDARRAMEWTRAVIAPETRSWLAALPVTLTDGDATLVHGSLRDPIWEYVTSAPVARASLAALGSRLGFNGHTHIPIAYVEEDGAVEVVGPGDGSVLELRGRRALVNPGGVGQPRDGDPRAAYLVLDTTADTVTWHRVEYDIESVQAAMRAVGLPGRLAARLAVGH